MLPRCYRIPPGSNCPLDSLRDTLRPEVGRDPDLLFRIEPVQGSARSNLKLSPGQFPRRFSLSPRGEGAQRFTSPPYETSQRRPKHPSSMQSLRRSVKLLSAYSFSFPGTQILRVRYVPQDVLPCDLEKRWGRFVDTKSPQIVTMPHPCGSDCNIASVL